jgi:hypothetical protein
MFAYHPSVGNSGGIITIWNGNALSGNVISTSSYQVTVEFTCNISGEKWYITNIYASCHTEGRNEFINWMNNPDSSNYDLWMLVGDFNMIRSNSDRNRPGGNSNTMLAFNDIIQTHDLEEIPLKGRQYTWSNMHNTPLLEKLDWIFTSSTWTITFPNTMAYPMARLGLDHVPILIEIGSVIPKAQIFRFEEYWLDFDGLDEVVQNHWKNEGVYKNTAQDITARFKSLRQGIKKWSRNLSQLSIIIHNCSYVLALLDGLEEQRSLSIIEKKIQTCSQGTDTSLTYR